MNPRKCSAEHLVVGSALYALEPAEQAWLDGHLLHCERARDLLRETEDVAALLGTAVPQIEPPARLRARLLTKVSEPPRITRAPRFKLRMPVRLSVAAAIVVAGVIGVQIFQGAQLSRLQAQSHSVELKSPDGRPVATLVTTNEANVVVPTGLPADNPVKESYVLWGVNGTELVPLATFDVGSGDRVTSTALPRHGESFSGYAISLEPGRTAPSTPTHVVASS